MEIKMQFESTVDDLVAKIVTHAGVPATKIRLYKVGYNRTNFIMRSVRGKSQTQRLFGANNYEECLLVRFSDDTDAKFIHEEGEFPVFVQLTDYERHALSE
jgi:hypothetical protein